MANQQMQSDAWNLIAKEISFNLEIDLSGFAKLISKDSIVLDFGCGYGRNSEKLHSKGYINTVGVDSSSEMVERGLIKYPHLSLLHSNSEKLDFPDNYFDSIILCAVLTCIPDYGSKEQIISEMFRLLKSNGIIHIVEFCNETEKNFESSFGVTMNYQTPENFRLLVKEFDEVNYNIFQTETMSGVKAQAVSYFGKKFK